jgi:hypothetical protein
MAKDKRTTKKENVQNVKQPDTAPEPGIEGAYYGEKPLAKHSPSYDRATHLQSEERPAHPGGIHRDQGSLQPGYPGRPTPKPEVVTTAVPQTGVAKKCVESQTEAGMRHDKKG